MSCLSRIRCGINLSIYPVISMRYGRPLSRERLDLWLFTNSSSLIIGNVTSIRPAGNGLPFLPKSIRILGLAVTVRRNTIRASQPWPRHGLLAWWRWLRMYKARSSNLLKHLAPGRAATVWRNLLIFYRIFFLLPARAGTCRTPSTYSRSSHHLFSFFGFP